MRRLPEPPDEEITVPPRPGRSARRASLPWVSVVAGAGSVTLVVAVAGMVGAATGGGEAVVITGGTAQGITDGTETGTPLVTPRRDEPRPTVTRIPPPAESDDAGTGADGGAAPPAPSPGGSAPVAPGTAAPVAPTSPAAPTPDPSPTITEPTADADPASATWVQERLRVHGATIDVTGVLDDATVAALRAFQQAHGLAVDGSVTAETAAALAAAADGSGGDPGGTDPAEPTPTPTPTPDPSPSPSVTGPSSTPATPGEGTTSGESATSGS